MTFQLIANGLASGVIYGMVALAIVLIFRSTGVLNFTQGEMATFTTFIAWTLIVHLGLPYWLGFTITVLGAFLLGVIVELVFMRPTSRLPHLSVLMVTLGLYLLFNALSHEWWASEARSFPTPFPAGVLRIGGVRLSWVTVGIFVVAAFVVVALTALFRFTKLGLAMRAVVSNAEAAPLMGISVKGIVSIGWGLSAAVGAIAGMLAANLLLLDANMMTSVLLFSTTAMVLAGMTSAAGAVVCGLLLGVINSLATRVSFIGTELSTVTTFIVIVAILAVRPAGLFGKRTVVKV
ncbi:branched-chain amino acid ABC transporter permease [Streptomyces sp. NPDC048584]|uniref:branched-chain amino acid ABC transporter permease n=1 Tax=Streptomyces sp. NPDC048584 TaxID=3365573 RepID=UPI003722FE41